VKPPAIVIPPSESPYAAGRHLAQAIAVAEWPREWCMPLEELGEFTLQLAQRIAQTDPWALRMAKRAVSHTLDAMGFSTAIASCFDMHHLGHTRALAATAGRTVVMVDLNRMKAAGRPE
jgi:hypothetical protein